MSENLSSKSTSCTEQVTDCPYCDFTSEDERKHANHVLACGEREVAA